MQKQLQQ